MSCYILSVLVYVIGLCTKRADEGPNAAKDSAAVSALRIELLASLAQEMYDRAHANAKPTGEVVDFSYQAPDEEYDQEEIFEVDPAAGDGDMDVDQPEPEEFIEGKGDEQEREEGEEDPAEETDLELKEEADLTLYDNFCLATFARLFQRLHHRNRGALDFVYNLPSIPVSIIHVLKMLMYSGTLPETPADGGTKRFKRKRTDAAPSDLGTRAAAMALLSHLCLAEQTDTSAMALSQLLWAATSQDFKTRTNAINIIARYQMFMSVLYY